MTHRAIDGFQVTSETIGRHGMEREMCKMQQIIQQNWKSEDPPANSQWKEIAQLFIMQQIFQY